MLILELQLELVESAEERRRGRGRDFQLRRPEDEEGNRSELLRFEREWVSWKSLSSQAGGALGDPRNFLSSEPNFICNSRSDRPA